MAGHFSKKWPHRVVLRGLFFDFFRFWEQKMASQGSWDLSWTLSWEGSWEGSWTLSWERSWEGSYNLGILGILGTVGQFGTFWSFWHFWSFLAVLSDFEHFFLLKIIFGIIYPLEMLFRRLFLVVSATIGFIIKKNLPYSIL